MVTQHHQPSALTPRLTNEARGANRAALERWDREISHTRMHSYKDIPSLSHTYTHIDAHSVSHTRFYAEKEGREQKGGSSPSSLDTLLTKGTTSDSISPFPFRFDRIN